MASATVAAAAMPRRQRSAQVREVFLRRGGEHVQQAGRIALDQAGQIGRGAEDAGEQVAHRPARQQRMQRRQLAVLGAASLQLAQQARGLRAIVDHGRGSDAGMEGRLVSVALVGWASASARNPTRDARDAVGLRASPNPTYGAEPSGLKRLPQPRVEMAVRLVYARPPAAPAPPSGPARCPRAGWSRRAAGRRPRRGSAPARCRAASGSSPGARTAAGRARGRCGAMPGPRSATVISTLSPARDREPMRTLRLPPALLPVEYLMALSTRLATAWLTSSRLATNAAGPSRVLTSQVQSGLLGHRLVQLGDVGDDGRRIDRRHASRPPRRLPGGRSAAAS